MSKSKFLLAGLLLMFLAGCQKDDAEAPTPAAEPTEQSAKSQASEPKPKDQTAAPVTARSEQATELPQSITNASARVRCRSLVKEIAVCMIKADGSTDAEVRNLVAESRHSPEECQSSLQALTELGAPLGCVE